MCNLKVCTGLCKPVLIDTWWNVNMTPTAVCAIVLIVLIDTWWNVNLDSSSRLSSVYLVLIDTWWNVN